MPANDRCELCPPRLLWRDSPVASRSGEGRLTEPTAAARPWRPELVFMPHCRHSRTGGIRLRRGGESWMTLHTSPEAEEGVNPQAQNLASLSTNQNAAVVPIR